MPLDLASKREFQRSRSEVLHDLSSVRPVNQKVQPVFIGGSGRSGTTILGKLLGMHEEVCLSRPIEARYITDNHGLLDQAFGKRSAKSTLKSRVFALFFARKKRLSELSAFESLLLGKWWSKPSKSPGSTVGLEHSMSRQDLIEILEQFKREHESDRQAAARNFLFRTIAKQSNFRNQSIWVDTSPPNIENAAQILRLWPEAKFIYIKRDGRDTAASIAQERWGPNDPIKALDFWAAREARANLAAAALTEAQLLVLSLEELAVTDREQTYERLLTFLQLEDSAQMRTFFSERVNPERAEPGSWVNRVSNPEEFERHFLKLKSEL